MCCVRQALDDPRVVAIGELGLDLFRDKNLEEQLAVLRPQLDLAVELNLPVIVHCRDAAEPMLEELRTRRSEGLCPTGVMHCWGGTPEEMHAFLDLGFYISFSGTVTFQRPSRPTPVPSRFLKTVFWLKPIVLSWLQCQDVARGTNRLLWPQWPLVLPICAV
jgi:Tat protein secretion system quality control protein TatD with DNase activity